MLITRPRLFYPKTAFAPAPGVVTVTASPDIIITYAMRNYESGRAVS